MNASRPNVRHHIVLGTGVLGRAVAASLGEQGIEPLMLNRSGRRAGHWTTIACDARDPHQLAALLAEPATLYVCSAPPYWLWEHEFPALAEGIARAAAERDVRIVMADNVYACGPCSGAAFREDGTGRPCSRKGRVRQAVAARLMAMHGCGRVRVALVRAATFFGPGVEQSSVGRATFESVLSGKPTYMVGNPDTAHAFTYVPDFAATLVRVAQDETAFGHYWHAPSHIGLTCRQFLDRIASHGGHAVKLRVAGKMMLRFLGLFNPVMRELVEMLYLHQKPWALSSELSERTLGIAATPLATAIARTVAAVRQPDPGTAAHGGAASGR